MSTEDGERSGRPKERYLQNIAKKEVLLLHKEEMVIWEERIILETAAHVNNFRATSTRKTISKEEFQKECMKLTNKLLNKALPEHYDNVLSFLRNAVNSPHLFHQANQEAIPKNLNMEPPNKKIDSKISFNEKDFPKNLDYI
ncbi:hypothetical protein NPIL_111381 [Nephila pilipes]|uniref:Uncharacterized protein n=1 Tax=Nephila pilipes TaxID=299642 RepID=A0A8X6N9D6_NEPPI|nr:hypothetical protein NPIL_111381 [Nephila pilipes]